MIRLYKFYDVSTATTSAAEQIDVRAKGRIVGALVSLSAVEGGADGSGWFEISFAQTGALTTHDTQQSFVGGQLTYAKEAAGSSMLCQNYYVPLDVDVEEADRLYLHTGISSITSLTTVVWLYVEEAAGRPRGGRRGV